MRLSLFTIISTFVGMVISSLVHAQTSTVGLNSPQNTVTGEKAPKGSTKTKAILKKGENGKLAKKTTQKTDTKPQDAKSTATATTVKQTSPKPPAELRPLTKKTVIIDARRLDGQIFTDTIRYIKDNPNVRLKLQNTTINPDDVVKVLKLLKDDGVLDQIREIGFVMLPGGEQNLTLNPQAFTEKVFPYLGHLEGIEFSCLGLSDKFVESFATYMPHLKSISLFGVGLTDKTVANLAKTLPEISKLHLVNTSVTSKSIPIFVKEFPYLKALGISGQLFKDADYMSLKVGLQNILSFSAVGQKFEKMNTIRELLMAMPKLHTLDVSESTADDAAAKAIAEVAKDLRNLNISETKITFQGIKEIVNNRDLLKFKMNNLKGIGDTELEYIAQKQQHMRTFHFAGASFKDTFMIVLFNIVKPLNDVTFLPAKESPLEFSLTLAKAFAHKSIKPQYLHIQARRLPETTRVELEKDLPKLRIEYAA
jgi:hypothetical protein